MTVSEAVDLVLAAVRRERAASSQHTYRWLADCVIQQFGAGTRLQDITRRQVQHWATSMIGECKPATIRTKVSFLTQLYKAARDHDIEIPRPTADLRLPKVNNRRRTYGKQEHIEALRPFMEPWRISIVELALHTGLRRLEIFRLQPQDIELFKKTVLDDQGREVQVELGYATIKESKTGESRVICLNPEAARIVRCWLTESLIHDSRWLIGPYGSNKRLEVACNFSNVLRRACEKAGLNLSIHLFRHGFASVAIERGAEPKHVQFQLGHRTITQTARYIHHNANALWPAAFAVSGYRPN
jgi:integrase